MSTPPSTDVLLRAFRALGKLVTEEYGSHYSLADIAETHGVGGLFMQDFTMADADAIRAVENHLDAAEKILTEGDR